MRHSYEDILTAVGEFGTWQFKRLLSLWLIMLALGAHYAMFQILSFAQDEFICDPPETANCKLTQSFLGGNNKAQIPSDVYFVLILFNFTYCIHVHNLCIHVRCIEINN